MDCSRGRIFAGESQAGRESGPCRDSDGSAPFWSWSCAPFGCTPEAPVESLPGPREVLDSVGRRLSDSHREADITAIAHDGKRLLGQLRGDERYALGRDLIRFRVDRPSIVDVAVLEGAEPYWLGDQGFTPTGRRLPGPGGSFSIHRRSFPAGWIGLGVNALDRSTSTHYFALIRGEDGSAPVVSGLEGASIGAVSEGSTPFLDDPRRLAQLPEEYRRGVLLRTRLSGRHDAALLRGRAWKSRNPSSPTPDQVVVSVGADASRSLAFTWRTGPESTLSTIRIAPSIDAPSLVLQGDSALVRSDGLVNDPVIRRHRVIVDGLSPDTPYVYAIADGAPGRWTPWQSVRTTPEPAPASDLHFLSMGDPQCGLEEWGKLLHSAREKNPGASFLMIAGDLVDRGNERTNWDHFFLRAKGVFDGLPMMPAVGNHEYLDEGPRLFRSFFALPKNGPPGSLVYSFEAGDAVFAVLDSEAASHDPESARIQAEWLDRTLERSHRTWKFVAFHHPLYPSHSNRPVAPNLKAAWLPIIDKHRVDLVIQGHDHAYLRTPPMRGDRAVSEGESGTVYIVSVSGTKFSPSTRRDYAAKYLAETSTYEVINVLARERRLVYRSFDARGRKSIDWRSTGRNARSPSLDRRS